MSADSTSANSHADSSTSEAALAKGKLLLSILSQRAAAARAEADVAELRLLLTEAQEGDSQRLEQWLHIHGSTELQGASAADRKAGELDTLDAPLAKPDSWQDFLPGVQDRLRRRADLLASGKSGLDASVWLASIEQSLRVDAGHSNAFHATALAAGQIAKEQSPKDFRDAAGAGKSNPAVDSSNVLSVTGFATTNRQHRRDKSARSSSADILPADQDVGSLATTKVRSPSSAAEAAPTRNLPHQPASRMKVVQSKGASEKVLERSDQAIEAKKLKALADRFSAQQLQEKESQHKKQALFSRMGGVVASVVAHVLLVLFLALFTLRLPAPPASLAFEAAASEVTTEVFEITEPTEVSAPDVPEHSDLTETFDVTENFSELTTMASSELVQMANTSANSLSNAALAATASAASGTMHTNASFFGAAASGNCFCYVIDGSGSMRNGPWDAAKAELLKSLASLKEKQRFYIIFFNRELSAITLPGEREPAPRALYATQENLEHARRWIDTLRIDIGAPPNDALKLGIAQEPDAIYLLTDGVTNVDVAKFLRSENRVDDLISGEQVRVPIHTIAFYSLDGQQLLKQIANENRGQFIYVPDPRKR